MNFQFSPFRIKLRNSPGSKKIPDDFPVDYALLNRGTITKGEKIMKRTILVATFIMTALSVCILGQTPSKKSDKVEKTKNEVIALADAFFKASAKMDAEAMERILSDDYVSIESIDSVDNDMSGIPMGKDLLIRFFKEGSPGGLRLAAIQMDETFKAVRVYGDTAVLVTKITLKWQGSREELAKKYKFMPKNDDFTVTLVAVKKNGAWQIVSKHQSEFKLVGRETPNPN
jgi:hypothetical protein